MSEKVIIPTEPLTAEEEKLLSKVDENKDLLIELLKNLIKIDSRTYDPEIFTDQTEIFEFVKSYFKEIGDIKIDEYSATHLYWKEGVDIDENKKWPNIIATLGNNESKSKPKSGKTLQLMGHLDTVPFNEDNWNTPPLEGVIKEDKIFGRGVFDMKGTDACKMMTMKILKESGIPLNGKLQIWFVPDEEINAKYGAQFMVNNHFDKVNADATIIGEVTGLPPLISPAIIIGEKGIFWARLTFYGAAGHGSLPKNKSNAINKSMKFMANIKKLKYKKVEKAFSLIDLGKSIQKRFKPKDLLTRLKSGKGEKDPYNEDGLGIGAAFNNTLSFNKIHAGDKTNIIPDKCELEIDLRRLPGVTNQDLIDSFTKYSLKLGYRMDVPKEYSNIQDGNKKISKRPVDIKLEVVGSALGNMIDIDSEFCTKIKEIFESVYKTYPMVFLFPGASDASHLRNAGISDVILLGLNGNNVHSSNEYILVDDLIQCTKVYLLTAYRMLCK